MTSNMNPTGLAIDFWICGIYCESTTLSGVYIQGEIIHHTLSSEQTVKTVESVIQKYLKHVLKQKIAPPTNFFYQ